VKKPRSKTAALPCSSIFQFVEAGTPVTNFIRKTGANLELRRRNNSTENYFFKRCNISNLRKGVKKDFPNPERF